MNASAWARSRLPQSIEPQPQASVGTLAPYRLGRIDRATQHYQPLSYSGDTAAQWSSDLMHRRTRDQRRNNCHIKRVVEAIQDLVVGCGMQTLADPFEPWLDLSTMTPADLDERLAYALESDELFAEWGGDKDRVDPAGRLDLSALQRMIISECVTVGQCFVVESVRRERGRVALSYQVIEAEHLDRSKQRTGAPGVNRIVDGVELDEHGRAVAFWLFAHHPDDLWVPAGESQRISADQCRHVFLPDRPSQHLGVTWLHATGQPEIDRDKFLTSELASAAKAAQFAVVAKKKNPYAANGLGMLDGGSQSDAFGNQEIRLGYTPVAAVVGVDESVEIIESNRPNSQAEPFLRVLDRYSAGGAGIGYYTLTGDYASTSFSSARAAKLDEDDHIRPIQQWFGTQVALPIRRRFNALAGTLGLFSTVSADEFAANPRRYQRFDAMGPGRELLDPDSETNAAISRLRSGLSTLKIECAKRGLHWVRVLRQIALENQLTSVLGVVLDFSKGQGGQVTDNTRAKPKESTANA